MKKIIGILAVAATLVASTFAFGIDLSIGGKGLIGGNIGTFDEAGKKDGGLVAGGGLYVNLGLFHGFGVQAEANFVSSQISAPASGAKEAVFTVTPCNVVDIPLMAWYNFTFTKIAIGGGVGVNFSTITNNVFDSAKTKNQWNTGIAVGANFKYYFNKHFGLVLGANGVFDLLPTSVQMEDGSKQYIFDSDGKRKSVYGTLGLEFKLF